MFYRTGERDRAKLPHDPFKAIVAPRPIGWISNSRARRPRQPCPLQFLQRLLQRPADRRFLQRRRMENSASFAKESGEFVANLATSDLRHPMNATSAPLPRGENEFVHAGLTMAECQLVAAPRVAESPAALECKVVEIVEIRKTSGGLSGAVLVIGEVVGVHIDDALIREGRFDTAVARPLARCGYQDYAVVEQVFALARPRGGGNI